MRIPGLVFLTFVFILTSCRKKNEIVRLIDGTWVMWYTEDKRTRVVTPKPPNSPDVILIFKSSSDSTGTFSGSTPSNQIFSNPFIMFSQRDDLRVGGLGIPSLLMSTASEVSWGKFFVDNFRNSVKYAFEADRSLFIYMNNDVLITFKKQ